MNRLVNIEPWCNVLEAQIGSLAWCYGSNKDTFSERYQMIFSKR